MKKHLNTLFVTTEGAYLAKAGDAVAVRIEKKTRLRVPLINLDGIVCFGRVACSPALLAHCAANGVSVTYLSRNGRFLAAVNGFTSGNVLLRREQYRAADDPERSALIARCCVTGKIANCRTLLRRCARETRDADAVARLNRAADRLSSLLALLDEDRELDVVRGFEGEAATSYFRVFDDLIRTEKDVFTFSGRNRRPPTDPVNALLSFAYTLLMHDVRSACESTGLDSAVGFLHRDRPGRPGLALDLMEELRPVIADRVVLNLINRRQIKKEDFVFQPNGAVKLTDKGRKTFLYEYQQRRNEPVVHPFLGEKMTIGFVPLIQARLLARFLRGDLDAYPPFAWK
ncbi:MAG: type I-C CRISPR-associated endonuclease Cas1 [Planctomycetota bacterium]|nr:MAG: type I-C CRISPR-associated endonuclease Cas1 [Planctomycetota bacterium]